MMLIRIRQRTSLSASKFVTSVRHHHHQHHAAAAARVGMERPFFVLHLQCRPQQRRLHHHHHHQQQYLFALARQIPYRPQQHLHFHSRRRFGIDTTTSTSTATTTTTTTNNEDEDNSDKDVTSAPFPTPHQSITTTFTTDHVDANTKRYITTAAAAAATVTTSTPTTSTWKAYAELGKARLSALVVTTTAAGFLAAGPVPLSVDPMALGAVLLGTAFCSCSAAAVNQIYEVHRDRQMKRTQHRPLVTGILSTQQATTAALLWGGVGVGTLWYGTDPLTTLLGASNILLYAGIYTPLKPYTIVNTWIGAIVGAIPPVMGYSAATAVATAAAAAAALHHPPLLTTTGATTEHVSMMASTSMASTTAEMASTLLMDPIAITLGATLYLWQLPHFMALSYMYRVDYMRGGFMMVPTAYQQKLDDHQHHSSNSNGNSNYVDATSLLENSPGGAGTAEEAAAIRTANVIVRYAWYLAMVPLMATACDITSSMYALESCLLNGYALHVAYRFYYQRTNSNARRIFLTSLWYLPCTLMLFLLHSKTWDAKIEEETPVVEKNVLAQWVMEHIHKIRNSGREMCVHEQAVVAAATRTTTTTQGPNHHPTSLSCPIRVMGTTDTNVVACATVVPPPPPTDPTPPHSPPQ
jgi:heme o synthase